ncbi:radical SAM family heme chaperone HemW [bacterium]|nr:radical SAM family heme chaperone HemW [bacterium]
MTTERGLYVHFPYCRRKCAYCDFNSGVASDAERHLYLQALAAEIAQSPPLPISTVYFGGGTPTLYEAQELAGVLEALRGHFAIAADAEITVEANPGTVALASLRLLRQAGFNRLSLGVQSLDDTELRLLGRVHTSTEAREAIAAARESGFDNLSLDLMRGLPGQTASQWESVLTQAVALSPNHLSVYGLILEPDTPLREQVEAGLLPTPEEEDAADWIRWTVDALAEAGYERYEISNYAQPGHRCRHNLLYWRDGEYVGLGAGAVSYLSGERRRNLVKATDYLAAALEQRGLVADSERLDPDTACGEAVMLGLRTTEGIAPQELTRRFGVDLRQRHKDLIARLVAGGLMLDDGVRLRLTFEGMLVQSAIACEFLP